MCTNFHDRSRWLHSILQRVEFCRPTHNPLTDVSWRTNSWPSQVLWKLRSLFLARVSNSCPLSLYEHVTFSDPPFWALSYDWSPLLSSQKCDDAPQNPPPSAQAINNDRFLKVARCDFWVTIPFTFDRPGHHHYHSNRTSNVSGVLKKAEESFKWGTSHQALSYLGNDAIPNNFTPYMSHSLISR